MTHTLRLICAALLAAATLASTACLQMDKTHTLYIAPDGTVTWVVVEKDVRSDERDAAKAAAEEHDYITHARAGDHQVATAFRTLNALNVSTEIIRETRPFTVITTAQFPSLAVLGQALVDAIGLDATSSLTGEGSQVRWTLAILSDRSTKDEVDGALTTLVDEPWHVVLEHGRFIGAENFRIENPQIAVQVIHTDDPEPGMPLVWSLTWVP